MSNPGAAEVMQVINQYVANNSTVKKVLSHVGTANPTLFPIGSACSLNGISTGSGLMFMSVNGVNPPTLVQFARAVAAGSSESHGITYESATGVAFSLNVGGFSPAVGIWFPGAYSEVNYKLSYYWNDLNSGGFNCQLGS
jgi:hypothetical protein